MCFCMWVHVHACVGYVHIYMYVCMGVYVGICGCTLYICTDVNECQAGTDNCDSNANCTNTMGSFTCACKTGYQGDGVSCSGK